MDTQSSDFLTRATGPTGNLASESSESEAAESDQTSQDETQESEIPKEASDSESESTEVKPQRGSKSKTPDDIRKLQSSYDRQIAALKKEVEASKSAIKTANDALMQNVVQQAQVENMLFEASIQQLPPDQQMARREAFTTAQRANIERAQREAEKANMAKVLEQLAPLAKQQVAMDIAQKHNIPVKELLEGDYASPQEMEVAAKLIARYSTKDGKVTRTAERTERKQDVFEGAGIGAASRPDLIKEYKGTGRLEDYLRASKPKNRR
jgi:hypothetical protein